MAEVQTQVRDMYIGAVELKRLTGWPDAVIELLLNLSDNLIVSNEAIDNNNQYLLIAPLGSKNDSVIAEVEAIQEGIQQGRQSVDLSEIEERIGRIEAQISAVQVVEHEDVSPGNCCAEQYEDVTPRNYIQDQYEDAIPHPIPYREMRFGHGLDYTEFEYDGTLTFKGDATVWKDIKFPMAPPKTTGAGNPTLVTWNGNLRGYSFAVNDVHDFNGEEIDHDAKVDSTATWHIHFISRDNETERTVKYQLEYAVEPASGAIPAPTTISAEFTIAAGTDANTPQRGNLGTFVIPGIAKLAYARLTRIASSGTEPTTDPVVGAIHFHYEIDTVGSREILTK